MLRDRQGPRGTWYHHQGPVARRPAITNDRAFKLRKRIEFAKGMRSRITHPETVAIGQ
jgi:hypothetical protein